MFDETLNRSQAIVLLDSVSPWGQRIVTFAIRHPTFILAQFNKHRAFSASASSTRAIPLQKQIDAVLAHGYIPEEWGKNKAGMAAEENLSDQESEFCAELWQGACKAQAELVQVFSRIGLHKQLGGRLLEPWKWTTQVVTATDWSNFYSLRIHKGAQPEMDQLARAMLSAHNASTPVQRVVHIPFVSDTEQEKIGLVRSLAVSAARCARVSYKLHDGSDATVEQDEVLAKKLLSDQHMTPFEHQAVAEPGARFANLRGWESQRAQIEPHLTRAPLPDGLVLPWELRAQ